MRQSLLVAGLVLGVLCVVGTIVLTAISHYTATAAMEARLERELQEKMVEGEPVFVTGVHMTSLRVPALVVLVGLVLSVYCGVGLAKGGGRNNSLTSDSGGGGV